MKTLRITAVLITAFCLALLLSGCARVIRSPADELSVNRWGAVTENGNRLELSFDEENAVFSAQNDSFTLEISGLYTLDAATLVINDRETHLDYRFAYTVHGDSVELTYGGETLLLDKK